MAATQWMLDVVVILLLGATLFHATRLERALGVLKRDRAVLEQLVEGFNASTREAQAGIDRLRGAADGAGRAIERQTAAALSVKDDLQFLIDRGEQAAERLYQGVRAARVLPAETAASRVGRPDRPGPPRAAPEWPAPERDEPGLPARIQPGSPPLAPPAGRVRSQAERDLLAALRTAR